MPLGHCMFSYEGWCGIGQTKPGKEVWSRFSTYLNLGFQQRLRRGSSLQLSPAFCKSAAEFCIVSEDRIQNAINVGIDKAKKLIGMGQTESTKWGTKSISWDVMGHMGVGDAGLLDDWAIKHGEDIWRYSIYIYNSITYHWLSSLECSDGYHYNSFEQEDVLSNIHNRDVHGSKYDKTPQRLDGFIPDLQMIDIILHNLVKKSGMINTVTEKNHFLLL